MPCHTFCRTGQGPGRTYSGFQRDQTIVCHPRKNRARAVSLGHSPSHTRENRPWAEAMGTSRASRPAISASRSDRTGGSSPGVWGVPTKELSAMTADLLAEPVGDRAGQVGHLGVVEAPGTGDGDRELVDDPAGTAGE